MGEMHNRRSKPAGTVRPPCYRCAMETDNETGLAVNHTAASKKWEALAERLATTLSDLSDGEFLVLCKTGTRLFVQFSAQRGAMRAEAIGNQYLESPFRLSPKAVRHLRSLGWQAPTYVQAELLEEPAEGSPNNYVDVPAPASYRDLAELAVRTFREVFEVFEPYELNYRGYSSVYDSVRFPQLGITRGEMLEDQFGDLLEEISTDWPPPNQLPVSINVSPC